MRVTDRICGNTTGCSTIMAMHCSTISGDGRGREECSGGGQGGRPVETDCSAGADWPHGQEERIQGIRRPADQGRGDVRSPPRGRGQQGEGGPDLECRRPGQPVRGG
ncbi:hypothetical protein ACFFX0_13275 [Citricoccus parietis]|uniref:Uncharacterized protein n=1 Tax=Citricoccus parietis TaxID=592307 RepID=A0ABV5FZM7_9MICC